MRGISQEVEIPPTKQLEDGVDLAGDFSQIRPGRSKCGDALERGEAGRVKFPPICGSRKMATNKYRDGISSGGVVITRKYQVIAQKAGKGIGGIWGNIYRNV